MSHPLIIDRFAGKERVRFGEFEFDLGDLSLTDAAGNFLKLQPQPLKVLALLVQNQNELVTREELTRKVWDHSVFVDFEHGLNYSIQQIRQVLGDDPQNPTYIQTVPRRGYRFIAPVVKVSNGQSNRAAIAPEPALPVTQVSASSPANSPASAHRRRARLIIAAVCAVFLIGLVSSLLRSGSPKPPRANLAPIRVAIVSFEAMNLLADERLLSSQILQSLVSDLGRIEHGRLLVIPAAATLETQSKSPLESARGLKADYLVDGGIDLKGAAPSITIRLLRVSDVAVIWTWRYQPAADIMDDSSRLCRPISQALALQLLPIQQQLVAQASAATPEAFQDFITARNFLFNGPEPDTTRALQFFSEAARKDPRFAYAHAGLAMAYSMQPPSSENTRLRRSAALKALELDDTLFIAHEILAEIALTHDWDLKTTRKHLDRSIQLFPWRPRAFKIYALYYAMLGNMDEAVVTARRAAELDPLSLAGDANLGYIYFLQRDYPRAVAAFRSVLQRNQRNESDIRRRLFYALVKMQRWGDAKRESLALMKGAEPHVLRSVKTSSPPLAARQFLQWDALRLAELAEKDPALLEYLVVDYALLGDHDKAFALLDGFFTDYRWVIPGLFPVDPSFDSLRPDPRYQSFLQRLNSEIRR